MPLALFRSIPLLACSLGALVRAQDLEAYDVVWRTPCSGPEQSMPIGNGEVGCNVWCTADGVVHGYVARTDSFSEASRLLKLGEFALHTGSRGGELFFEQRLCLREGCVRVTLGQPEDRTVVTVFVDSEQDVVHLAVDDPQGANPNLYLHSWRKEARRLQGDELASSWTMKDAPADVLVQESADWQAIVEHLGGGDGPTGRSLMHTNRQSCVPATVTRQGLPAESAVDLLQGRTFGLFATCSGATFGNGSAVDLGTVPLGSTPGKHPVFRIAAPCVQLEDAPDVDHPLAANEFLSGDNPLTRTIRKALDASPETLAATRTRTFWQAFWQRSWVFVDGDAPATRHAVPSNVHPLRLGVDSDGGNRFHGSIERLELRDSPAGGTALVTERPGEDLPRVLPEHRELALRHGLSITATVQIAEEHPIGRIVDKLTAGRNDGFLFDTHPGNSLRLIVGDRELVAKDVLRPGQRHEVSASFDAATGIAQIHCDGVLVAMEPRSWTPSAAADSVAPSRLTQALVLQRWVQACAGRGRFPIKFNGSLFPVEPKPTGGQPFDADWRRWGDCYWWQNTRLPYYPMLAQGDFDMQAPLFALYRATLPTAIARAKAWHGVDGAYWPETMTPFGTHANGDYGWQRDGVPASKVLCPWWEYARNQGLELLALLLDRYDFERDPRFFTDELLPIATPVLQWFANAYPRTTEGQLRITPTQALETHWHGVENDLPTVAGLHWCLARLRTLAPELVPADQLAAWAKLERALPPIPRRQQGDTALLAPAAKYDPSRQNCESPELYAVFPFRHFGLGKPELGLARATFAARHDRFTNGWPQDGQLAALLGLVDEARANVLAKLANTHRAHRFPVMWGPNFDWCPDQCHGSNLLDTVHRMLLQADGERILLLPCWPKEWNVSFRLHAPRRTVVECEFRDGRLQRLVVTPKERERDVVRPN